MNKEKFNKNKNGVALAAALIAGIVSVLLPQAGTFLIVSMLTLIAMKK